ncbi:polysaccharide biosynthesis protein [Candidatus Brocadia sinica JPN1]|uniref:Polysaccharide biosynthesis protein n=1 Tax=Candidatus Brocadia sinica JPN1 TaxID=1197129 RepID=A0ABQ0K211_9BACT|nr:polysaccharide biosynthesis protein [Candidatus Brocadia sinica JPN1]GIK11963.1 MAG: hypothetical protein BroJett002_06700 [Candidatus Brocadia sinica]GJQ18031.1 MAG: hypothetical protein HBSIN01_19900 [Candidatus Brocadia sinica]
MYKWYKLKNITPKYLPILVISITVTTALYIVFFLVEVTTVWILRRHHSFTVKRAIKIFLDNLIKKFIVIAVSGIEW